MRTASQPYNRIVIITTAIFVVLTVITMRLETDNIAVGFPWAFYTFSGTGGDLQYATSWSIQPAFFILEWLMIAALLIVANEGLKKIRR